MTGLKQLKVYKKETLQSFICIATCIQQRLKTQLSQQNSHIFYPASTSNLLRINKTCWHRYQWMYTLVYIYKYKYNGNELSSIYVPQMTICVHYSI